MLIDLNITDLHQDIWEFTMELLCRTGRRTYLPSVLGINRPFPLLVEVHRRQFYLGTVVYQRHYRLLDISDPDQGLCCCPCPVWFQEVPIQKHSSITTSSMWSVFTSIGFFDSDSVKSRFLSRGQYFPPREFHLAVEGPLL